MAPIDPVPASANTGPGQRPIRPQPMPKDESASNIAGPAGRFFRDFDDLAIERFLAVQTLDDLRGDKGRHDGGKHDAKHVEALEMEHFLDAIPGRGFDLIRTKPNKTPTSR
jgi:hypothetical protein